MASIKTGNHRRRNRSVKEGGLYTLRRPIPGRSWNHKDTTPDKIVADLQLLMQRLGAFS